MGIIVKIFKKELFKRTPHVISDIFVYIFNELIKEEDTEIKKPIISEESFAVLHCNQRFGHVLTVNKNLYLQAGVKFLRFLKTCLKHRGIVNPM
jgi:hypothetical protein